MAKITEYEKVTPDYLNDPAKCGQVRAPMPVNAATLFEALKDNDSWKAMLPVDRVEWHAPLGPDTSRTIAKGDKGALEQFMEWEEGRMFSFYLKNGSIGILKSLAERYEAVPVSDDASELILTYRIETKGMAKPLGPLIMGLFKTMGGKSMKKLAAHLSTHSS